MRVGPADRGGDLVVVETINAFGRPAMRAKSLELIVGNGQAGAAVDRDRVVVPQQDQLVEPKCPASEIASWLIPSIRQPSPQIA